MRVMCIYCQQYYAGEKRISLRDKKTMLSSSRQIRVRLGLQEQINYYPDRNRYRQRCRNESEEGPSRVTARNNSACISLGTYSCQEATTWRGGLPKECQLFENNGRNVRCFSSDGVQIDGRKYGVREDGSTGN